MDSGVVPSKLVHDHNNEHQETQGVMENQHHHHDHHEKKSVMKKVKEKARKIKDTIKHKHGLNNNHDHDLTDEDDDNKPSEIHGAPIYDSATYNESGIHQEPRIVVVTPTTNTESDDVNRSSRTFVEKDDEKLSSLGQPMVNLERKVELEEDPHAPTSRLDAYTPSNYETKVTDPTGQGRREIDITPVEDSLARMTVVDEVGKAKPDAKVFPTHESPYPSVKSHGPSVKSHGQFSSEMSSASKTDQDLNEYSENFKAEPKVVSSSIDTHIHNNYPPVHGLVSPDLSTSSNKTDYPHDPIHTISNDFPRSQHVTDMFASSNKTEYPHDPIHTYSNEFPKSQHPPDMSACSNKTEYPHEPIHSYSNEFPKSQHPPNMSASSETQHNPYVEKDDDDDFAFKPISPIPSETPILPNMSNSALIGAGSHNQFLPEEGKNPQVATSSSISDKNAIASSDLGYYGNKEENEETGYEEKPANQTSYTEKISNATSAIVDKAVSAKNVVASKLGYGEDSQINEEGINGGEKPSNQTSYTEKISSATSAMADKAVSAKNVVASKLGYGDNTEEYKSGDNNTSNHTSYTDKISSATSAIADKAISAKNVVASKLGYGEKDDDVSEVRETREASELNAENAQKIALSLSEELAPVYRNYERKNDDGVVMEQDKGVSVKDYLSEKLRPGEEDMALKDVISDTLQNKPNEETLRSSLDDAVMRKQEEDQLHLEKVTTRTEFNKESESPGKGVVGKLKDYVVGSWFGKPGDNTQSTTPVADSEGLSKNNVVGEAGCVVEDRRP